MTDKNTKAKKPYKCEVVFLSGNTEHFSIEVAKAVEARERLREEREREGA